MPVLIDTLLLFGTISLSVFVGMTLRDLLRQHLER